jgi:hypothetical protein
MLEFLTITMIMSGYLLALWCVFALFSGMWNLFFVIFDPTYLVCILVCSALLTSCIV